MKNKNLINILVLLIVIGSLICSLAGLFWKGGNGQYEFKSINNEIVKITGSGIYKNDSVSITAQGKAIDMVTLVLGIPILLISLYFANRRSFRGRLILTGTIGYFLYTYMSYTFLWMYNPLFIVYVFLMSSSLFTFILLMMSFDMENINSYFDKKLPIKFLGGFQIFIAFAVGMLWLGKIAPSIFSCAVPVGLEHYTTLVIQGMDLGFVVPTAVLSGVLLIKRRSLGYLLSSVVIIKGITLLASITAGIVYLAMDNVSVNMVEVGVFSFFDIVAVFALVLLMKNIKAPSENRLS